MSALLPSTALAESQEPVRDETWAVEIADQPGLPNLFRVDENLYRSAQPNKTGLKYLRTLPVVVHGNRPIQSVLSLRAHSRDPRLLPDSAPLKLLHIRFNTWHAEDEDVIAFLRMAKTPNLQPMLVHCMHGADRTGMMVAIYRVAYQGWSKAQALDEMQNGGFGFHPIWKNLLWYFNQLDIDALKRQAELQGPWQ